MAKTTFYLAKLRYDPETRTEKLQAVNGEDDPFDLVELFAAMIATHKAEADQAQADDGVVLEIVRKPLFGSASNEVYAFGHRELGELLEHFEKGGYGYGAANNKIFVEHVKERFGLIDDEQEEA